METDSVGGVVQEAVAPNHTSGVLGSTFTSYMFLCQQKALNRLRIMVTHGYDTSGRAGSLVPALDRGSGVHLMLHHHYVREKALQEGAVSSLLPPVEALMTAQENGQVGAGFRWTEQLASVLYDEYVSRWQEVDARCKILAVEEKVPVLVSGPVEAFDGHVIPLATDMCNMCTVQYAGNLMPLSAVPSPVRELYPIHHDGRVGFWYAPTVDLVLHDDRFNTVIGIDHKTTSMITGDTHEGYTNHAQFIGMCYALVANSVERHVRVQDNLIQVGWQGLDGRMSNAPNAFARPPMRVWRGQEAAWGRTFFNRRLALWKHLMLYGAGGVGERVMDEKVCHQGKYAREGVASCEWFDSCRA